MLALIALALGAQNFGPTPTNPLARCMSLYAAPRLKDVPTATIVAGAMQACAREWKAERQNDIRALGPERGEAAYQIERSKIQEHMIGFVNAAKAQRGYR